jgi:hypothetical protein
VVRCSGGNYYTLTGPNDITMYFEFQANRLGPRSRITDIELDEGKVA